MCVSILDKEGQNKRRITNVAYTVGTSGVVFNSGLDFRTRELHSNCCGRSEINALKSSVRNLGHTK
ncbi:hypothetical protein IGI04_014159 [Brassica rapa subsp. trilocularis]|uniref:Uncharacterized protein n=1 Tax=Brassica rapa subsp. trilocularis TaxID=1813537 RepID=A0ABQ7MLJ5_BRACM|nr:hypothetical protein IGI04_014159 [Brassica rapa subsp. trilocularis]